MDCGRLSDMKGFWFEKTPFHQHDCTKCKFLFSVKGSEGEEDKIDVYESCQKDFPGNEWIIRFSSDGPDYATVDLKSLSIAYAITHKTDWKVNYT